MEIFATLKPSKPQKTSQLYTCGFRVLIVDRCFQSNRTSSLVPARFHWTVVTLFFPKSGLMFSVINYDFICWNTTTKSLLLCFSDYIVCNCWMREGLQSLVFIILKWQWWHNIIKIWAVHSKDVWVIILALHFILTKVQLLKCNMHCAIALLYKLQEVQFIAMTLFTSGNEKVCFQLLFFKCKMSMM